MDDYASLIDAILDSGGIVIPRLTLGFGTADFRLSADLLESKGIRDVVLDMLIPDESTCIVESVIDSEGSIQCASHLLDRGFSVCLGSRRDPDLEDLCVRCADTGIRNMESLSESEMESLSSNGYVVEKRHHHFGV